METFFRCRFCGCETRAPEIRRQGCQKRPKGDRRGGRHAYEVIARVPRESMLRVMLDDIAFAVTGGV